MLTRWVPYVIPSFLFNVLMLKSFECLLFVFGSLCIFQSIIAAVIRRTGTAIPSTVVCWSILMPTVKSGRRLTSRTCRSRSTKPCSVLLFPNPSLSRKRGKVLSPRYTLICIVHFVCLAFTFLLHPCCFSFFF